MSSPLRKRTYEVLEVATAGDSVSRTYDVFLIILILLNVVAVMLDSLQGFSREFQEPLRVFELFSVCVFTIEYVLRLWSCSENPRFTTPVVGRLRYVFTPLALIDLLAILPFFLPMLLPVDLRYIRMFRLFRLIRLFKMVRYSESFRVLGGVFKGKKEELAITLCVGVILLIIGSSLMYFVENAAQPEVFSSIPAAMWWGVATLTTVGYGDLYPITPLGKSDRSRHRDFRHWHVCPASGHSGIWAGRLDSKTK